MNIVLQVIRCQITAVYAMDNEYANVNDIPGNIFI